MRSSILLTVLGAAVHCLSGWAFGASLTLTRDGRPAAVIVLADRPTRAAQFAAFELQSHVAKITGATLPILREERDVPAGRLKIYVGASPRVTELGFPPEGFRPQEYVIHFPPEAIVLAGRDKDDRGNVMYRLPATDWETIDSWPTIWDEQGTMYAVYDFLERFCGVRWFDPTEFGTYCPENRTLVATGNDIRRAPLFHTRVACDECGDTYISSTALWREGTEGLKTYEKTAYPDLFGKYGWSVQVKRGQVKLFRLRMREAGEKCFGTHSLYHYYERFWTPSTDKEAAKYFVGKRPEMFAKGYPGDGQPPQMCYTSPELVKAVVQEARDYFDHGGYTFKTTLCNAPLGAKWGENFFCVEPMDNAQFCKCPACQEWIERGKDHGNVDQFSQGIHSDYFFQFVNAVAREVKKTHPNKRIVTLAYMTHAYLPRSFKLEPNIDVFFCFATNRQSIPKPSSIGHEMKLLADWAAEAKVSGRGLYLWLYYAFPKEEADNGKFHCFPGFFAHAIGEQFRLFHKCNIRGFFHCGYGQEVEAYVTYKLMDDPTLDVDRLLDEYFSLSYGPAGAPLRKLYCAIEDAFCDPRNLPDNVDLRTASWKYRGTKERMAEFAKLVDEAGRALAEKGTEIQKKRFKVFLAGTWSYMQTGRAEYERSAAAPIPSVQVPRVATAEGDPAKVDWTKAASLSGRWYPRTDKMDTDSWVSFSTVYDVKRLAEITLAEQ